MSSQVIFEAGMNAEVNRWWPEDPITVGNGCLGIGGDATQKMSPVSAAACGLYIWLSPAAVLQAESLLTPAHSQITFTGTVDTQMCHLSSISMHTRVYDTTAKGCFGGYLIYLISLIICEFDYLSWFSLPKYGCIHFTSLTYICHWHEHSIALFMPAVQLLRLHCVITTACIMIQIALPCCYHTTHYLVT